MPPGADRRVVAGAETAVRHRAPTTGSGRCQQALHNPASPCGLRSPRSSSVLDSRSRRTVREATLSSVPPSTSSGSDPVPGPEPAPARRPRTGRARRWFGGLSETGKVALVTAVLTTVIGGAFSVVNAATSAWGGKGNQAGPRGVVEDRSRRHAFRARHDRRQAGRVGCRPVRPVSRVRDPLGRSLLHEYGGGHDVQPTRPRVPPRLAARPREPFRVLGERGRR